MTGFTVVIIIYVVYQLISSALKKSGMQPPGKLPEPLKMLEGTSVREEVQGISRGTWRDQLKQALENSSYQAGSMNSPKPMDLEDAQDYYVETEGTQGVEGTSEYVGILGAEAYKTTDVVPNEEMSRYCTGQGIMGGLRFPVTERELVQGVVWAEILGKPRAMHPYRGPRT